MSDLGAIFHVTADGKQYDAHAYTTTDECPEPNLKVMYKGQQAYVKLDAKGAGDMPCYVKKENGKVYQVLKEAIPNDTLSVECPNSISFTVPKGIKVIQVSSNDSYDAAYIGVTPGAKYDLDFAGYVMNSRFRLFNTATSNVWQKGYVRNQHATLAWNSRINQEKVTVYDYK